MPDIYFDVSTALMGVPVNVFPLTDDTDFKSRETTVAYDAPGMDLVWNFVTSAGVMTQTAVTPTTGGDYDWVAVGDGMYTVEMPASGGASANNTSAGYGWFTGVVTGVLPWRGPIIGFRAAATNDALCDGGDRLPANVTYIDYVSVAAGGTGAIPALGIIDKGTAQAVTASTIQLRNAAAIASDEIIGSAVYISSATTGAGQIATVTDYDGPGDTATVSPAWTTTPTGTVTYIIFAKARPAVGLPIEANITQANGTAISTPIPGRMSVNVSYVDATSVSAGGTGAIVALGIVDKGTAQAVSSTSIQLRNAAAIGADDIIGAMITIDSATTGAGQSRLIVDYDGPGDTATVSPAWTTTPTGTVTYSVRATPPASPSAPVPANVVQFNGVSATSTAGRPEVDTSHIAGAVVNPSAAQLGVNAVTHSADSVTAASIATDAIAELVNAIWAATVRTVTAGTNIVLAKGTGVTGFNDLDATAVQAAGAAALAAYDPPTYTEMAALIAALNDASVMDILTTQMTESYAANGVAPTLAQAILAIHQHLMDFGISGTARTVNKLDGTTAFVETLDGSVSPTGLSR